MLVGPIFFALIQAGLERGARAGVMVGLGVWVSDLLFILAVYYGVSYVSRIIEWPGFEFTLGAIGSVVLIAFGAYTLLTKPPHFKSAKGLISSKASYATLWLKGFLVNTINPFTVFFWVSVMTTAVLQRDLGANDAFVFFSAILGTIVLTDTLKVLLAKRIRSRIKRKHFIWMRRISGIALIVFGIVLLIRVSI
jgi:threonine/homoserine/homoserine lactone efflux protein